MRLLTFDLGRCHLYMTEDYAVYHHSIKTSKSDMNQTCIRHESDMHQTCIRHVSDRVFLSARRLHRLNTSEWCGVSYFRVLLLLRVRGGVWESLRWMRSEWCSEKNPVHVILEADRRTKRKQNFHINEKCDWISTQLSSVRPLSRYHHPINPLSSLLGTPVNQCIHTSVYSANHEEAATMLNVDQSRVESFC